MSGGGGHGGEEQVSGGGGHGTGHSRGIGAGHDTLVLVLRKGMLVLP